MVQTRRRTSFASEYPLFLALAKTDSGTIAELCATPGAAAACGPGGFGALHFCALLGAAEHVPALAAAGAPLDGKLSLSYSSPGGELAKWLESARAESVGASKLVLKDGWRTRYLTTGASPLSMAIALGHLPAAKALLAAGASIWELNTFSEAAYNPYSYLGYTYGGYGGYGVSLSGLLPTLAEMYSAGQLAVPSSQQLAKLIGMVLEAAQRSISVHVAETILSTAADRQAPGLAEPEASRLLIKALAGRPSNVVVQALLDLGASPNARQGAKRAAELAAQNRNGPALDALLDGGAEVTPQLMASVMHTVDPALLQVLVKRGRPRIPVDRSQPQIATDRGLTWSCPVLCLLSIKPKVGALLSQA